MNNWTDVLGEVKEKAKVRLAELAAEKKQILQTFPDLKRPYTRRPVKRVVKANGRAYARYDHWTQKPENHEKMLANLMPANVARAAKRVER